MLNLVLSAIWIALPFLASGIDAKIGKSLPDVSLLSVQLRDSSITFETSKNYSFYRSREKL